MKSSIIVLATSGQTLLLCLTAILIAGTSAECPPPWEPLPSAVGSTDYIAARSTCTASCNEAGMCCTVGYGGCNFVPCNEGCHIAFFSSNLQACYDECDVANNGEVNSCSYTHTRHSDVGHLGFNPAWTATGGRSAVEKCWGSEK